MSPEAGRLLLNEVSPRIYSLAATLTPIGCEDREELCQDAIAIGAALLASTEARAKTVTAGNVAFFAAGLIRQGRRSSSGERRNDPLHPSSQVRGRCQVMSLEEPIGGDGENEEAMCLHDVLAARQEDPSMSASRRLDWEYLIARLDTKAREVLQCLVSGSHLTDLVPKLSRSRSALQTDKERLAVLVREQLGPDILARIQDQPRWRDNIEANRERVACRFERQLA